MGCWCQVVARNKIMLVCLSACLSVCLPVCLFDTTNNNTNKQNKRAERSPRKRKKKSFGGPIWLFSNPKSGTSCCLEKSASVRSKIRWMGANEWANSRVAAPRLLQRTLAAPDIYLQRCFRVLPCWLVVFRVLICLVFVFVCFSVVMPLMCRRPWRPCTLCLIIGGLFLIFWGST